MWGRVILYKLSESFYGLESDDLFCVANRINKKRSFLFANKVIGKYLSVKASDVIYHSMLLARRLNEAYVFSKDEFDWGLGKDEFVRSYLNDYYRVDKEMIFVGFAETATGLGQGVFDRFNNSVYVHTTRETIMDKQSTISFEEVHSHATSHRCYGDDLLFDNRKPIILVDDEVTTGRTNLNIIKEIQRKYPRDEYVIVSYLNWMEPCEYKEYRDFEKSSGVTIKFVYLMSGEFDRSYTSDLIDCNVIDVVGCNSVTDVDIECDMFRSDGDYIVETGRFGITHAEHIEMKSKLAESTFNRRGNLVVIGDGELLYIPTMIAYYLGDHYIKSTARNRLYVSDEEDYVVKDGITFDSLDGKDIKMNLYNMCDPFEEALVVVEKKLMRDRLDKFVGGLVEFGNFKKVEILKLAWELD